MDVSAWSSSEPESALLLGVALDAGAVVTTVSEVLAISRPPVGDISVVIVWVPTRLGAPVADETVEPVLMGWDRDCEVCGVAANPGASLLCQFIWNMGANSVAAVILAEVADKTPVSESVIVPDSHLAVGIVTDVAV